MDTLERDLSDELAAGVEAPVLSKKGNGISQMAIDKLEGEMHELLALRASLKERCRACAALIIEIERSL